MDHSAGQFSKMAHLAASTARLYLEVVARGSERVMDQSSRRELTRRLWFVQERIKRLGEERKQLTEEKRKGSIDLDIRQISRLRAYILVRLTDLQEEVAALTEEGETLKAAIKSAKANVEPSE